jgi:hypothetical protein
VIFYLVTARHSYAVELFLQLWRPEVRKVLAVVPYEQAEAFDPPPGTYIFADLERLTGGLRKSAETLQQRLDAMRPDQVKVLNDPRRALGQYELLERLRAEGINDFRAFRLSETRRPARFPVFFKVEGDHGGRGVNLMNTQTDFELGVTRRWMRGVPLSDLLVVEFCDTRMGRQSFRKYSAFVMGDQVIPRHMFTSDHWVVKHATLMGPGEIEEELDYVATNPHREQILHVARLGGYGYGRIDYSLLDDRMQVWEFNTNPVIFSPPEHFHPSRVDLQESISRAIAEGFENLDEAGPTERATQARGRIDAFRPPALSGAGQVRAFARDIDWVRRLWRGGRTAKGAVNSALQPVWNLVARLLRPLVINRLEQRLWG